MLYTEMYVYLHEYAYIPVVCSDPFLDYKVIHYTTFLNFCMFFQQIKLEEDLKEKMCPMK